MRHKIQLQGVGYALRPVGVADATFILTLRGDPHRNQFINETPPATADQEDWIRRYENRPGDWYFIITRDGQPTGTVGIYDHDENAGTAEWGRWILLPGSLGAIESALLVYRVAFEMLDLQAVYCRTVAENESVLSFHDSTGALRVGVLPGHVTIRGKRLDMVEHRVDRPLWARMQPRLEALAARLANSERRTSPMAGAGHA